ncbi:MAG TPA: hypothetical protein VMZ91_00855 [Candidatus Paceibacterota bacterium]|nr:hypothetical protein [Candidatus Paceibacterota bacterium]
MKPEEKAEIVLWDWLKTKGKYVEEIYFNRKNNLNAPTFQTKGINKKPDFIIKIDRGYGIEFIAVEIKTGSDRNIHDSGKIISYYENYILEKTKYYINNEKIKINHFCVASENSINGCLFGSSNWISNELCSKDKYRMQSQTYGFLPTWETQRTSDFQRRLWAEWRNLKKRLSIERKKLSSIGILISKKDTFTPYLFVMWWTNKNKWGQRFWRM